MSPFSLCLVFFLALISIASAQYNIGPASFIWPPPRLWNHTVDNIPPCGSPYGAGHRTNFSMEKGYVAFVAQDESWNLEVSVSFMLDPKSVADFVPFMDRRVTKLGVGIACINVPNAASHVKAGDKATFQLRYFSDYDSPTNQSFFACADITYVDPSDIPYPFPCINTTVPELEPMPAAPTNNTEEPKPTGAEWSAGKESGLPAGIIALIAILSAIGFAGLVLAICMWIRLRKERRLTAERLQEEAEWQSRRISEGSKPRPIITFGAYGLQDMSHVMPQQSAASENAK